MGRFLAFFFGVPSQAKASSPQPFRTQQPK